MDGDRNKTESTFQHRFLGNGVVEEEKCLKLKQIARQVGLKVEMAWVFDICM